jgi:large-conductance mechanosensitive channel
MALDLNTTNVSELVVEVGKLGTWLQAIGIIVIAWLIFQIISLIINLQKKKMLQKISEDVKRLEKKVDSLKKRR